MSNQQGYVYKSHNAWHVRFYIYSAKGKRTHKSQKLCDVTEETQSKESPRLQELAATFMRGVNEAIASEATGNGHNCVCGARCTRTFEGKFSKTLLATRRQHE